MFAKQVGILMFDWEMAGQDSLSLVRICTWFSSVQSLSRVWLCSPMDRSTSGLPVHCQLPEFTQTHEHWVGDAIQPSHPLLSPSPAFNLSQHQMSQLFSSGGQSIGVSASVSVLPMNIHFLPYHHLTLCIDLQHIYLYIWKNVFNQFPIYKSAYSPFNGWLYFYSRAQQDWSVWRDRTALMNGLVQFVLVMKLCNLDQERLHLLLCWIRPVAAFRTVSHPVDSIHSE